ncbi:Carboxypeptidase B [Triplophysa tibetana]|uniref:Carboxypeptidase B n=1 Tax=Triplophysa tibetana TaxID=1572043 RepID=A0A5A9N9J4_9TELE|nr:Carboxypeptidase B [Triplophysa tibetana]
MWQAYAHPDNMKVLLLLGLVAVALCEQTTFVGERVLRLKPETYEHVSIIQDLSRNVKVDFWKPDSADVVTVGMTVDIHVAAPQLAMVSTILHQSDMEVEVLIGDLQVAVEAQMNNKRLIKSHDYMKYNNWNTINDWVISISSANPDLISRQVIGNTYEGRPMHLLTVGKKTGSVKPAVFMDCGFHAREWITPAFCQWFVQEAVSTYGSNAEMTNLLDKMDFFVLPVFNIDGYEYTWTKDRMWRKTRSRNSGSSCVGTDPNRNFNAGWCTVGASSNPCSETYCGASPESEIESKNLANFIRTNKSIIKAYLTLSVAQGATSALTSLYGTKYEYGPGAVTIYPAAGGSDDWAYDLGIKYAYTFELRDTGRYGFLLPESEIKPTCEETMLAVKYIASHVAKNLY